MLLVLQNYKKLIKYHIYIKKKINNNNNANIILDLLFFEYKNY